MYDPVTESMIASGVLNGVVLVVFTFRLWIRIRMQRVGWEDIWATAAFVCGMLNAVSNWVYLVGLSAGQLSLIAMWIYMLTLTCLVWAVRISIVFSIIRIIPAQERLHAYGLSIIIFFLLSCSALIVQKAIFCNSTYHAFKLTTSTPYFHCNFLRSMSISALAVGSVADIIAIVFPLYVLRSVTLPPRHLRLLRLLFSSTVMVPVTCWLGLVFRVVPALSSWSMFVTDFQIATCLIVCNLLVVVTYLYCALGRQKYRTPNGDEETSDENEDATAASSIPQQMTLTTIELLLSTHSVEHATVATVGSGSVPLDQSVGLT